MATLEAIQHRIKKLQAQAEAIATKQNLTALEQIRSLMDKHGLTVADIDAHLKGKRRGLKVSAPHVGNGSPLTATAKGKLPPKYLNPKTGETWSGHARPPQWIAGAKDRSKFLIAGTAAGAAPSAAKPKKVSAYVRGPQPAMYRDPKTGATWSGRGRAPAWLAGAKDRTKFLIAGAPNETAAGAGMASKKTPAKKVGTKKAASKAAVAEKVPAKRATPAARKVAGKKAAAKKGPGRKTAATEPAAVETGTTPASVVVSTPASE
jgi:DNA-binding protein H-NS